LGNTTDLRREINRLFVPYVQDQGFIVVKEDLPLALRFWRIVEGEAHIFDIQWEKYGLPRFMVNLGRCPAAGLEINGQHFAPENILPGWTPEGGRLQPRPGFSSRSWFRQDKPFLKALLSRQKLRPADELAVELVTLFVEAEMWWRSRVRLSHLHLRG